MKPTTGGFRTNKKMFCLTETPVEPLTQYLKVQLILNQKAN